MEHVEFEKKLMDFMLSGNDSVLEMLRTQYMNSMIESSRFTGAGFFTHFKIKPGTKPVAGEKTFQITDIKVIANGVKDAIGFILFIENGYLSFLEGYTLVSNIWPEDYSNVTLSYIGPNGIRDLKKLKLKWS